MSYSVEIKFKNQDLTGYSEDSSFIFNYEIDSDGNYYSSHQIDCEKTGWTTCEILDILKMKEGHPAFENFFDEMTYDEARHPNTPVSSSTSTRPIMSARVSFSDFSQAAGPTQKEVVNTSKTQGFFNSKNTLAATSALILDSVFLIGLAIAGLLNAQHLVLISIGLIASTAIAISPYYFNPSMN